MTDREKLVDLLETHCAVISELNCKAAKGEKCTPKDCANCLADHLIAHGVTVREPQKPLTLDELPGRVKDIVYVETIYHGLKPWPAFLRDVERELLILKEFGMNGQIHCGLKEYGREYRFWAEKPTEEERKDAEWEK